MPLVVVTGHPSSGKSTRAQDLKEKLEERIAALQPNDPGYGVTVILHSDESLGIVKERYRESVSEKSVRGTQISAVKRDLGRKTIVILDSLAYIKGFRYQLHCESKAMGTPYCLLHIIAPTESCYKWNEERDLTKDTKWDKDLIDALIMRYEEPNHLNRWDSPLVPVPYDEPLPFESIWESIILKKAPRPNSATVLKQATTGNFLQQLDKHTSDVISKILQFQQLQSVGGEVLIDREKELLISLPPTTVSVAQLQRIRRSYIALNRMRTIEEDRIVPLFVDYLNAHLNNDE
ncbi:BA75_04207T0 [Komagataella pastoris]|uniref:BA75_04207T0 n=1 Tax=Komagataella pastoris TaxID=4922 RepID=A0A1B2JGN0_PICPA|nr:BA75_04207T0 [Komagataella pastoris]